jgi:four helix bundle protein
VSVQDHRQLLVWTKSIELAIETYRLTRRFPRSELYALAGQMQRASTSVAANIAEGNGRAHGREYAHHLSIARGSLREVDTYGEIALGLGYLTHEELAPLRELLDHVGRMLTNLMRRIQR